MGTIRLAFEEQIKFTENFKQQRTGMFQLLLFTSTNLCETQPSNPCY